MPDSSDTATLRILDASLNRASEGLRVVEDYARFALNDRHLAAATKACRHDLAAALASVPFGARCRARDAAADVGAAFTTASEATRATAWSVCCASTERVKQALRSVEEYAKLSDPAAAAAVEALRYRFYSLEKALGARASAESRLLSVRLYVLVDGGDSEEAFVRDAAAVVGAGVHAVQLRDKSLDDRRLLGRARRLVAVTRQTGALAIVNDRADIAAAADADGVHLGQDDVPVAAARAVLGPDRVVGVSAHSLPQALSAVTDGADYIGVGPTFPSATKAFEAFTGLELLRRVAAETSLPAFAIGGVSESNTPAVLDTGIRRIAVASAVAGNADPAAAARRLLTLLRDAPRER